MNQGGDPLTESRRKPSPLEEIKDILPFDQIKSFLNIKLEEERWSRLLVEPPGKHPHEHEVFMNSSPLDEGTLGIGNEGIHVRA